MSKFKPMRIVAVLSCAVIPFLPGSADAQDEALSPMYANCQTGFAIIFPGASKQPTVRDTTYTIPYYANNLPAREYSIEKGENRYSVTVVDFSTGPRADVQVVEQAAAELRKKGEVRFQAFAEYEVGMPGRQLNIFAANNRQLRASVYMAYHKLFITQADAVVGDPDAIQFEQSIVLVDTNGMDIDRVGAGTNDNVRPIIAPCR
jgi:hypothetical protein